MHILVEPSDYILRNVGDMSMLRTALSRLSALWPRATIEVLSDDPVTLRGLCPAATPLASAGRRRWLSNDFLPGHRLAPHLSRRLQVGLRNRRPELIEILWRRRLRSRPRELRALNGFTEAVARADLVIATGMGGITDAFPRYAADVLETLWLAVRRQKYVAMVGQGLGPLQRPELLERARSILPCVDFIGLREERASWPLLRSLGVASTRVMTTGDDAIEMANQMRGERLGECLGVTLRASDYSGVDQVMFRPLRHVLQTAARRHQAQLLPIPISRVPGEADADTIRHLTGDEAGQYGDDARLDSPEAVIRRVQRCRVVVTGSYHAGVFALASGIPAIGLARSAYYVDKFQGLSQQFGEGCQTVLLAEPEFARVLQDAIERLWGAADLIRPSLLARAATQIGLGHQAYQRIYTEVCARA